MARFPSWWRERRQDRPTPVARSRALRAHLVPLIALAMASVLSLPAQAEKRYGPGVTDAEIKLGQTMPYSGPASAYSAIGRAEAAYFEMINSKGGVNGRKIRLISVDDEYNPAKTVEQVRKLVEQEEVLAIFSPLGTVPNTAIHKYLNGRKVPQIFLHSNASKWHDPRNFPWTMAWPPDSHSEIAMFVRHMRQNKPNAKIGVLHQGDDYGKDIVKGLRDALGADADKAIVAMASYEVTDPNVDSQIVSLQASGADTFFNLSTPKFAALAIRKAYDIGWKPLQYLPYPANSVGAVLTPAGLAKSVGIVSSAFVKDPTDSRWDADPGLQEWRQWMKQYNPNGNLADALNVWGYSTAQTMVQVLRQCGDELTRDNLMRQAANLKDLELPLLLPGIRINTSAADYGAIRQFQLQRFDGTHWVLFGDVMGR
jgi:branched-chain amino acid transport system substrate-binding protein